jgi:hypothetical protein
MVVAALLFGVAPFAVVKLCGGSWGVFAVAWLLLLLLAGLAWLGRRGWGWVQSWRAGRVLRREEVWDNAGNDHYDKTPGRGDPQ